MSMGFRPFGRTGLMVSPFTMGTMEFGSKVDETEASRLLSSAFEAGVRSIGLAARGDVVVRAYDLGLNRPVVEQTSSPVSWPRST